MQSILLSQERDLQKGSLTRSLAKGLEATATERSRMAPTGFEGPSVRSPREMASSTTEVKF